MKKLILLIVLSVTGSAYANQPGKTMYYLGTNSHPINNTSNVRSHGYVLNEYNMDGHLNLEKELSEGLPQNDIELAEKIANERLEKVDWSKLQKAFQGLALATAWDIKKLPAFVFGDGQFVIYGVTDANEAIRRWEQYSQQDRYRSTRYR